MGFYNCSYNGNSVTVQADNEDEARSKAHDDLHSGHGFLDLDAIEVYETDNEKHDYIITCESGIKALVSAEDAASANATWDAEVASGNAEPRIRGMTELADESDVRACVASGHDYRDAE